MTTYPDGLDVRVIRRNFDYGSQCRSELAQHKGAIATDPWAKPLKDTRTLSKARSKCPQSLQQQQKIKEKSKIAGEGSVGENEVMIMKAEWSQSRVCNDVLY